MKQFLLSAVIGGSLTLPTFSFQESPASPQAAPRPARPPRPGVSTPGVKQDIATLKPTAVFSVEGTPDWQAATEDAVWVSNGPKNTVHKLGAKSNKVDAIVEVGQ